MHFPGPSSPRRASRALGAAVALGVLVLLGCGGSGDDGAGAGPTAGQAPTSPSAPPVVLVSIDTLRSDRLPAYGYDAVETPALERLATDGVVVERAYSPVPLTLPAHTSLFTGLLPAEHGVRDNTGAVVPEGLPTLAEQLRGKGYSTAGAVSAWVLRGATGIGRGFDLWNDEIEIEAGASLGERERSGRESLATLVPWLEERPSGAPFFAFLHLFEPHDPYTPPEPFRSTVADPYDGEIAAADAVVGELLAHLDRLGLYEDSLIVVTADHGEGLGDHGEERHGVLLYREAIQVPLLVKLPAGERAGERLPGPVRLQDVTPFLLGRAGAAPRDGRLERALAGEPAPEEGAPIFAETLYPRLRFGWSELRSVIVDRYHLVLGARPELYDLLSDPAERQELSGSHAAELARLQALAESYDVTLPAGGNTVGAEEREALMALGYLSGTVSDEAAGPLAHPSDKVHVLSVLQQGIDALQQGSYAEAIRLFERVLAEAPRALDALQLLGVAYERTARFDRAVETYERAFEVAGGRGPAAGRIGRIEASRGRHEPSLPWLRAAQQAEPDEAIYPVLETDALLRLGRADEALGAARQHRDRFPDNVDLLYQLAVVEMGAGLQAEAEQHLEETLVLAPDYLPALGDLAILLTVQGRFDEARELFERALSLAPDDRALQENYRRFEEMAAADG